MMVRVLRVVWVAESRPVVLALQLVHVKPASTAPKARACVRSAYLARQPKIRSGHRVCGLQRWDVCWLWRDGLHRVRSWRGR